MFTKLQQYDHVQHTLAILMVLWALSSPASGQLDAPAPPDDPASARFTLADILERLNTGAIGSRRNGPFMEPLAGPSSSGINLDLLMAAAPFPDDVNGATDFQCLAGRSYWSLQSNHWGPQLGAMPDVGSFMVMPGPLDQAIPIGFHNGQGVVHGDSDLDALNVRAGVELFGITGDSNIVDTRSGTATAADILAGQVAWVDGQEITGTLPTQTLSPDSSVVAAGNYLANDLQSVDSDLNSANIRAGTQIFGVDGNPNVVDTGSGNATAADILEGQIAWAGGQQVMGTLRLPTRFTDNNDGTITDNNTGLVWLQRPFCLELPGIDSAGRAEFPDARNAALALRDGLCGLSDGSVPGDWFIPNIIELGSLVDRRQSNPAIFENPFGGPISGLYWTLTPAVCAPIFLDEFCQLTVNLSAGGSSPLPFDSIASLFPLRRN
ncbi:MAG: hypothetical protein Tsb002_34350 [Wenzhouxiangellaceae bacterium]